MIKIDRLADAMEEAGLSQAALAARVGLSAGAIQQLLNGKTKRSRYVREIALALGVAEDWLLGASDIKRGDLVDQAFDNIKAFVNLKLRELYSDWPEHGEGSDLFIDFRLLGVSHYRVDVQRVWVAVSDLGRDMIPSIWPTDIVVVEWESSIDRLRSQDEIWAVGLGGLPMLRRIRRMSDADFILSADSPEIRELALKRGEFDVFGPVIWIGRQLRPDDD